MKISSLIIVWNASKNLDLPNTLSGNTPLELVTRKITVEIPQNIKLFPAKDETLPRLESSYAVKTDSDTTQINTLENFPLYFY